MNVMLIVMIAVITVAAVMALFAWRVVRDDRRRSEARIAALAADIEAGVRPPGPDVVLRDIPIPSLFAESGARTPRRALTTMIGAGALVIGGAAAMLIMGPTGADPAAATQPVQRPVASTAVHEPTPLELLALTHERENDRLVVRGTVRNPGRGAVPVHLAAVVLLFNGDGGFITSGRADMNTAGLTPGGTTPFVVTVPNAEGVGRYRVSFRSDDRVVPHVDRRQP